MGRVWSEEFYCPEYELMISDEINKKSYFG
jgi:hypothetical protein